MIGEAFDYLFSQSYGSFAALFACVIIFEIPRYLSAFMSAALFERLVPQGRQEDNWKVTVVIAGHNEAASIPRCVASLNEQSRLPDEIIVFSDGSVDGTEKVVKGLLTAGQIDQAFWTELRGGKSAGFNTCCVMASGDIIVNIDCDCSLDRDAIANIIRPFSDRRVGGVSGNIQVRNRFAGFVATMQAIEYLISISLGKQAAQMIDQVTCASGGYSAFRKSAYDGVGGSDAGGGEDLDLTLRLRAAGWKIKFQADSICYTDVPDRLQALINQRFRWERDAVSHRFRRHRHLLNPFDERFDLAEAAHQFEFLIFNVIGAVLLPIYTIWLFSTYGWFALTVLVAIQLALVALDVVTFLLAAHVTPYMSVRSLFPYVFGYSLFNGFFMRFVRLAAYLQEWIFKASYRDAYVPEKVHKVRAR